MTNGVHLVAKKTGRAGGEPAKQPKTTVKLSVDVHRKLRTIASDQGLEIGELLDQILRPIVEKGYRALGDRIMKEDS